MKVNHKTKTLIIENPLTGNTALAKLFKAEGDSTKATPKELRKDFKEWDNYTKCILLRLPEDRFNSGATLLYNSNKAATLKAGASKKFCDLLIIDGNAHDFTDSILKAIKSLGFSEAPIYLRPQSDWLSCKVDFILATHHIAEYATSKGLSLLRSGEITRNPKYRAVLLGQEQRSLFSELYADDIKLSESTPVWTPVKGQVRFVTGVCSTCVAKQVASPESKR